MKKTIIITILFVLCSVSVCAAEFTDVINDAYGFGSTPVFDDISGVPWAAEAIDYFTCNGLIKQNFERKLYPDKPVTREEFVDLLISAFGIFDSEAQCSFTDIENTYYGSIATANKYGIVNGITDSFFGFGENITRQDLVSMSYRILEYLNIGIDGDYTLDFVDSDSISDYAKNSVAKLKRMGIINGDTQNCFNPHKNTTRAEAYKIIYLLMLKNA